MQIGLYLMGKKKEVVQSSTLVTTVFCQEDIQHVTT